MKNEHDTVFHVQHVVEMRHLEDDVKVLTSNNYFVTQDLQNRDDDDPNRQTAKPEYGGGSHSGSIAHGFVVLVRVPQRLKPERHAERAYAQSAVVQLLPGIRGATAVFRCWEIP